MMPPVIVCFKSCALIYLQEVSQKNWQLLRQNSHLHFIWRWPKNTYSMIVVLLVSVTVTITWVQCVPLIVRGQITSGGWQWVVQGSARGEECNWRHGSGGKICALGWSSWGCKELVPDTCKAKFLLNKFVWDWKFILYFEANALQLFLILPL